MQHRQELPAFVAECTLGRLAKWLRLAGFDTLYDLKTPELQRLVRIAQSQNRFVLSRTLSVIRHLSDARGLLIAFNAPLEQMRQVIRHFKIQRKDLNPLSRCSRCNSELQAADIDHVQSAVPDFIRQSHGVFLMCPQCCRLYWSGSHSIRIEALIDSWFEA